MPDGEDLCFVSDDGDYTSPLARDELSPYLAAEWRREKGSSLTFYSRLTAFLEERFPEISLADELERDLLVEDLEASRNFASTRRTLRQLRRHNDFSDDQLRRMIAAALSNNQIYWIGGDRDINQHLRRFVRLGEHIPDFPELETLRKLVEEETEDESTS